MRISYVDTSAALELVIDEAESAALQSGLESERRLVSSWLLHAEMHCAAGRHPQIIDVADVNLVLDAIDLVDLARGDMIAAGTLAPLRTGDAIHLAVAIRLGADGARDLQPRADISRCGGRVVGARTALGAHAP